MQTTNLIHRAAKFIPTRLFRHYCEKLTKEEYEAQQFQLNERTIEYRFVLDALNKIWPNSVLDVGTGTTSLPHMMRTCGYVVSAIDNITDYWPRGLLNPSMFNRHWHIIDDDVRKPKLSQKFDFITCISTLEHIKDNNDAVKGMFSLLNSGGHMVLTFPYNEERYCDNVYKLPGTIAGKSMIYVCQAYSRANLNEWLAQNGGEIVEQEYWDCFTGDYWSIGSKLHPPRKSAKDKKHHLTCVLIRKP